MQNEICKGEQMNKITKRSGIGGGIKSNKDKGRLKPSKLCMFDEIYFSKNNRIDLHVILVLL